MCVCVLENQRNVSGHKQTHCENAVRIKDNPIESDCETLGGKRAALAASTRRRFY